MAYFYSSLDTLSWGKLCQLMGPWKLLAVSFSLSLSLSLSLVAYALSFLSSCIHMSSWLELCTIFLLIASIPISCKLYHGLLCLANCTISKPCKLTSCKLYHNLLQSESCKLSTCKLSSCKLSFLNLCTLSSCKLLVRTYVFHMLRTYVMILCNWLIL